MLFCTYQYLIFFVVVFSLYWAMPWRTARIYLLLVASFYFYASWNKWLALIVFGTTVVDYLLARGMSAFPQGRWRRVLLIISLVMNLGLLCYFKYVNFFLDSLETSLQAVGASVAIPTLQVLLPIGISFYTFEAISYTVDVYRGRIPAERNLAHFLLFITFFPHLVAGPIVRARDFLPQVGRRKRFSWMRMQLGMQLFLLGMIKKLVIADRMAFLVDPVFKNPELYRTHTHWIIVFAYAFQIYCDFSGYSDMALGSAHMLGYKLTRNFNLPYLASSISDFWRRWHISLSTWIRDYLFIPLGGSRGGILLTVRNLLIAMTLCGFWHGANWNFILFGLTHGLLLCGYQIFKKTTASWTWLTHWLHSNAGVVLCTCATFTAASLAFVLFRAQTLSTAGIIFQRLFWLNGGQGLPVPMCHFWLALLLMVLGHLMGHTQWWARSHRRVPGYALGVGYALVLSLALVVVPNESTPFVYFQF